MLSRCALPALSRQQPLLRRLVPSLFQTRHFARPVCLSDRQTRELKVRGQSVPVSKEYWDYVADEQSVNDAEVYRNNTENYVGTVKYPIGVIGPLKVNGEYATKEYVVPMATHEGALLASYSRGAKAITAGGGVTTRIKTRCMLRAPEFAAARELREIDGAAILAHQVIEWSKSEITSPHISDNTETALDEEHCRPGLGAEASSTKDVDMTCKMVGSPWPGAVPWLASCRQAAPTMCTTEKGADGLLVVQGMPRGFPAVGIHVQSCSPIPAPCPKTRWWSFPQFRGKELTRGGVERVLETYHIAKNEALLKTLAALGSSPIHPHLTLVHLEDAPEADDLALVMPGNSESSMAGILSMRDRMSRLPWVLHHLGGNFAGLGRFGMEHPELVGLNGPYRPPGEILLTTAANPLVDGSLRDGCLWPRRRTLLLGPAGADLDVALLAEGAQPQLQSQETPAVWNEMPLMVESHKRRSKTAYCEIRTSQGGRREEAMNLLKADGLARPASNEESRNGGLCAARWSLPNTSSPERSSQRPRSTTPKNMYDFPSEDGMQDVGQAWCSDPLVCGTAPESPLWAESSWWGSSDTRATDTETYVGGWLSMDPCPHKSSVFRFHFEECHPWAFVQVSPKRRIAALDMLGTLVLTAFHIEKERPGFHFLSLVPHLRPEWCAVRHISATPLGPEALGAFGPASLAGPSRIATFTLPVFIFENIATAHDFYKWVHLEENQAGIKDCLHKNIGHLTEERTRLRVFQTDRKVHVSVGIDSQDAAGQNKVTYAGDLMMQYCKEHYPGAIPEMYIEGGFNAGKRVSVMHTLLGKGHSIVADCIIPKEVCQSVLRTTPYRLQRFQKMHNRTNEFMGGISCTAHVANGLAAFYIATGNDPACTAESQAAVTHFDLVNPSGGSTNHLDQDLYASITLNSIIVASVGGGTSLPSFKAARSMMGVESANELAEICAGVALSGELSFYASMETGSFADAHWNMTCPGARNPSAPCTLEWRSRSAKAPNRAVPRVALCLLGVPRFFDDTAQLLRRNLLDRVGRPADLFTFVTASRRPAAPDCPQPHRLVETVPGDGRLSEELRRVAPSSEEGQGQSFEPGRFAGDGASLLTASEWQELEVLLQDAVAGQVAWGDRPMEPDVGHDDITGSSPTARSDLGRFQEGAELWHPLHGRQLRTPGAAKRRTVPAAYPPAWVSGLAEVGRCDTREGQDVKTLQCQLPAAGLGKHRHLAVVPWQEIDSEAIWLPKVQGEFFANDRFAVVPRPRLAVYFEGWKLLVSGDAEDALKKHMPRVGTPFFLQDLLVYEGFLHLRLVYAGAHTMALPPLFYVYCRPSSDSRTFRSLGFFDCSPLAALADVTAKDGGDEASEAVETALGGAKYSNEVTWVISTDSALRGLEQGESRVEEGSEQLMRLLRPRLDRLRGNPEDLSDPVTWTKDDLFGAVFLSTQMEVSTALQRGQCQNLNDWRRTGYVCSRFLTVVLELAPRRPWTVFANSGAKVKDWMRRQTVMQGFEPKPDTKNLSGLFMGYVRSIQQSGSTGKGPKGPMQTQWKGAPGSAKGRGKGQEAMPAMPSIAQNAAAQLQEEAVKFATSWGLDDECIGELLAQPPQFGSMQWSQLLWASALSQKAASDCGFRRVDASLGGFNEEVRAQRRPLIVHSIPDVSGVLADTDQDTMLRSFGHMSMQLETGIDESAANFRLTKEWRSLERYVHQPTGGQELAFEHGFTGSLSRSVWSSRFPALPSLLKEVLAFPILTLGVNGTGTSMHKHEETWLLLLSGRKAWWISEKSNVPATFARRNPCQHIDSSTPPGYQFCIQQPGEVVYFPDDAFHATCNIDSFVWGLGSQGSNADWPPLVMAASLGDAQAVTTMLKSGEGRPTRASFAAALQRSLGLQQPTARRLMKYAANFVDESAGHAVGYCTTSPVHAAAESGDVAKVQKLLSLGFAAEEAYSETVGFIALEIAAFLGHTEVVELLARQRGPLLQNHSAMVLGNALRHAAQNGHSAALHLLSKLGAELVLADAEGRVALHYAAAGGQRKALKTLRSLYLDPAAPIEARDHDGLTPLHAASERGHLQLVRFLLGTRSELTASRKMEMPVHLAARQGHASVVQLLLSKGAGVSQKSELGTPLHAAIMSGCRNTTELLLKRKAPVHERDSKGNQALHVAAKYGDMTMVKMLLKWRADVSALGDGGPAWKIAQRQGFDEVAELLQTPGMFEL
ncbi:hmgA [Symbiodinium microadriaticum]|nr:hmgA [Symbiodinium microadriaticum]